MFLASASSHFPGQTQRPCSQHCPILHRRGRDGQGYAIILGRQQAEVRPKNNPSQPKLGAVKLAVMKRRAPSAAGNRWPIIPKREDRQTCLITWSAT
jgi:hypothetical protein